MILVVGGGIISLPLLLGASRLAVIDGRRGL
jgi:hypothetical protein